MGLKYYFQQANNLKELSSQFDGPIYANISLVSHKKQLCSILPISLETSPNLQTYDNIHAYNSIRNQDAITSSKQVSSALETSDYSNICMLSSKLPAISDETAYAKLVNTISNVPPSKEGIVINSQTLDDNTDDGIYKNIKSRPISSTPTISLKTNPSLSKENSSSSAHTYINFERQEDSSPTSSKSSRKNEHKEESHYSPLFPMKKKPVDIETHSKTSMSQTVKKLEVNMAPNCGEKSGLYRTKIPPSPPVTQSHPLFRQRRTVHRSKRHRRRSSTPFRSITKSNASRRQQHRHSNMNSTVHRPVKSVSNKLYNAIQQPSIFDNQSMNSVYSEEGMQVFDYPTQFHKALQHHIFAWYPTVTYNEDELVPQVLSTSENGEPNQQEEILDKEEVEEFLPHNTFEDFLLRRPRKSSSSTTTSATSTVNSKDRPVRPPPPSPPPLARRASGIALGLDKNDVDFIHDIIHRTHGDQRVSNRITALREAYVRAAIKRNDLLKTKPVVPIDQNKRKKSTVIKPSSISSKIRDELERYDELPMHRRPPVHYDTDEDDDDNTYSTNEDYRFYRRALPTTPSTVHRILSFIITVKRQLQKSFQDFRTRVLIETMAMPPNSVSRHRHTFHEPSMPSRRYVARSKLSHDIVHRHNSHHPSEHLHRQHLYRTRSNTSQLHSQQSHGHCHPSFEQHSSRRSQTAQNTPRQQHIQRRN